ncbi:neutral/alkaline non-lysosomal ceramidase N-terminal domain-containing protein [Paenibacillus senegalensis]|uniref:neutral/alkaline non-lysosomal ceramidase N-terminal domain-containing protein n=1 Tax=Paenibacillus senegalensis TaxID=1465766 RepID=UPI0002888257|nr:neutral/alkaline non-lysosomal ceramidase N-terminal domain-containing protein [Paenibacillus senegalensis]
MGRLWMGTAKIDITPKHSIELAGFESRLGMGGFRDVDLPLYARLIYYRHSDSEGRETRALLVSADLIWWDNARSAQLRRRLSGLHGIPEDAILLHGTHNHSGPQTSDQFSVELGTFDLDYVQQLEDWIADGAAMAEANLEPVSAAQGSSFIHLGVNRRVVVDSECLMEANLQGPLDPELRVVSYSRLDGSIKAVLFHYGCHPVITRENRISSEFTGYAMDLIEEAVNEQTIAAYLQGWCGDINPAKDGELLFGCEQDVREHGQQLADEVMNVLRSPQTPLDPCPLIASRHQVMLSFQSLPTESELLDFIGKDGIIGEWSRRLLEEPDRMQQGTRLDFYRLPLARQLSLLAVNSEVVVEYGLYVKQLSSGECLPLGYTNGMIGYVPTARQLSEGGYEADQSTKYFLLPSPFDFSIEHDVRRKINWILNGES